MKTMWSPGYLHNVILATHALELMMYMMNVKTMHHLLKCMCCRKAIVVISGKAHCFHDCIYLHIYYAYVAFVRFEPSVCRRWLMTTYI